MFSIVSSRNSNALSPEHLIGVLLAEDLNRRVAVRVALRPAQHRDVVRVDDYEPPLAVGTEGVVAGAVYAADVCMALNPASTSCKGQSCQK